MKKAFLSLVLFSLLVGCNKTEFDDVPLDVTASETNHFLEKGTNINPCPRKSVGLYDLAGFNVTPFSGQATGVLNDFVNGCPIKAPPACSSPVPLQTVWLGSVDEFCSFDNSGPLAIPSSFSIMYQDYYINMAHTYANNHLATMTCTDGYSPTLIELEFVITTVLCICPEWVNGVLHDTNTFIWVYGKFGCCSDPIGPTEFPLTD